MLPELTSWVDSLYLSEKDHQSLRCGECLTANHICAAHRMLKSQFPGQNGLQDTHYLSVYNDWKSNPENFVQILYVNSAHWVCLSNCMYDCENGCVDLYDSMISDPPEDGSIVRQACTIMKSFNVSSVQINIVKVTQQVGGSDCGVFAIAMATDLCFKSDPFHASYVQDEMRSHLERCFESGQMTQFPRTSASRDGKSNRLCSTLSLEIFCICRQPEAFLTMVCCDDCDQWFHEGCMTERGEILNPSEDWFCSSCALSGKKLLPYFLCLGVHANSSLCVYAS